MGRRSIPKIDPSISIDSYLHELADLEPPLKTQGLFGLPSLEAPPLEIEIGSGKGLFLINAAVANPDRLYLGIEIARKYARLAAYRMAKQHSDNSRMICGDAMRFMHEFVPSATVAAVHIYFPDPWWKERHRRRRVINDTMVQDIQRVLSPGGIFHFWTDVEEYFASACDIISTNTDLSGPIVVDQQEAAHDMDYRTHFERRMRLNDHPVFRSQFRA